MSKTHPYECYWHEEVTSSVMRCYHQAEGYENRIVPDAECLIMYPEPGVAVIKILRGELSLSMEQRRQQRKALEEQLRARGIVRVEYERHRRKITRT